MMEEENQSPNALLKVELQEKLVRFQKKLVKIIEAESRISKQYSPNRIRLQKQADARYKTMNDIDAILCTLLDMGETFKIKRKKKSKE
jgi:hypothetical protein